MDNDIILDNMETISNKLNFYKKKFSIIGWDQQELRYFYKLGLEYNELEHKLFDNTFNDYILEDLLTRPVMSKLKYLKKHIGWKFNTLINREDIINVQSQFNGLTNKNKEKVANAIFKLRLEIESELNKYSKDHLDVWEDISLLFSHDNSNKKEIINDYINRKFFILINILGGEQYYEQVKKSS